MTTLMTSASKDHGDMSDVTTRYASEDTFRDVANLLFGDGATDLVYKSLTAEEKRRQKKQAQIGLATNIVGLAAGAAGTAEAAAKFKAVRGKKKHRGTGPIVGKFKRVSPKIAIPAAAAAGAGLGLQVANVAGDTVANRVLAREAKKKIEKSSPDSSDLHIPGAGTLKRKAAKTAFDQGKKTAPVVKKGALKVINDAPALGGKTVEYTRKKINKQALDVRWEGEISKLNEDKQQVFGWASIVEMNGEPVVDLQGDYISIDEVEKSAYEYVQKSRQGGDMHLRDEWNKPKVASQMIESFIVTPEKKAALNLPEETPLGWWVGYQVNDPEVWAKVKSGERTGFSIHGAGIRTPADA